MNENQNSASKNKDYFLVKSGLIFFYKHSQSNFLKLSYFWLILWLRFFYHQFISGKKEVLVGIKDFLREKKNFKKEEKSDMI